MNSQELTRRVLVREANITCPRCRFRHPTSRTCAEATRLAEEARAVREARIASELPTKDQKLYEVPEGLMDLIYETLKWYGNECSYQGERTGGVLQGCPRGPAPTPERLTLYARQALKRIDTEVLKR